MPEFPQKDFYKLNEVCQYTDTQPYVLRFWESEFPQLKPAKGRGGQLVYSREDIDLVRRIKQLLHEEECTLESARQELSGDPKTKSAASGARGAKRVVRQEAASSAVAALGRTAKTAKPAREPEEAPEPLPFRAPEDEAVSRQRYDHAVEEIEHLRLRLKENEKLRVKADAAAQDAVERAEHHRLRSERAAERIQKLLDSLS